MPLYACVRARCDVLARDCRYAHTLMRVLIRTVCVWRCCVACLRGGYVCAVVAPGYSTLVTLCFIVAGVDVWL